MRALDPIPTETSWRTRIWEQRKAIGIAATAVLVAWGILSRLEMRRELRDAAKEAAIPTVAVAPVKAAQGDEELVLPGNVQPYITAPIYARTNGYVRRWLVDIGAQVKAGQILAELDTPEVDQQFYQTQADLRTAESNEKLAQVTAERWAALLKTDSVSKQDADEKISDYKSKQAITESARANLRRLEELQNFKRIVAPFDGTITARNIDIGQLINSGSGDSVEMFHISSLKKLRVYVQVPEPYAPEMHVGLEGGLHFPEQPNKAYAAAVTTTADALNPNTRTLLTELEVDNAKGELFPGAYTDVHFQIPRPAGVVRIPATALIFRGDGLLVAAPTPDNHIQLRPVKVGRDFGTELEVTAGLDPGTAIVINPPDSLQQDQLVRVIGPSSGSGSPAAETKASAPSR